MVRASHQKSYREGNTVLRSRPSFQMEVIRESEETSEKPAIDEDDSTDFSLNTKTSPQENPDSITEQLQGIDKIKVEMDGMVGAITMLDTTKNNDVTMGEIRIDGIPSDVVGLSSAMGPVGPTTSTGPGGLSTDHGNHIPGNGLTADISTDLGKIDLEIPREISDDITVQYLHNNESSLSKSAADLYAAFSRDLIPKGKDAMENLVQWIMSRKDILSHPGAALAVVQSYAAVLIAREQRSSRMHSDFCQFMTSKVNADALLQTVREKSKATVVSTYLKEKFDSQRVFVSSWVDAMKHQQVEITKRIEQSEITQRHKADCENIMLVVKKYWPISLPPILIAKYTIVLVMLRRTLVKRPVLRFMATVTVMLGYIAHVRPDLHDRAQEFMERIRTQVDCNGLDAKSDTFASVFTGDKREEATKI